MVNHIWPGGVDGHIHTTVHICHETLEVRPRVWQGFHSPLWFWSPISEQSLRTRDSWSAVQTLSD